MQVPFVPTVAVSMALAMLVIFTLNILLREFGAADVSGAGSGLDAVTQPGSLVVVLVVALHDDQLLQRRAPGAVAGRQR
jgi:phospholipid/cholesterol/gamma-HCH transport system permease protein